MRRLRGRVNDKLHRGPIPRQQRVNSFAVANVEVLVGIALSQLVFQAVAVPARGCFFAEEPAPHVVVDANDVQTFLGEVSSRLRPDQPGGTSDDRYAHTESLCLTAAGEVNRLPPMSFVT